MPSRPESVAQWLDYARADQEMAAGSYSPRVPKEFLCYHAQQAAEKALKAVLILRGIKPPWTHAIEELLDLLPSDLPRTDDLLSSRRLTDYATGSRYPRQRKPVTVEQYREAVRLAEAVVQWRRRLLKREPDIAQRLRREDRRNMQPEAGVLIRTIRLSDATSLKNNILPGNTVEEVSERIQGFLDAYATGECLPLVAEADGKVVGIAVLQRESYALYRHRAKLVDMVVCSAYQRRGIARRLIEALRSHAAQIGVTTFLTSVRGGTPAEEVYRRVGFQEYGRLPSGIVETWGEHSVYDEVLFRMATKT